MGAVFAILGGLIHWVPVLFGITLNRKWLKAQFILIFFGVNLSFFPQHFLGFIGMPRRYSDYSDLYVEWNAVSSLGSAISVFSLFIYILIFFEGSLSSRYFFCFNYFGSTLDFLGGSPLVDHSYSQSCLSFF